MRITIKGSNEIIQPANPHFHYIICSSDNEFPEIYNRGLNVYAFSNPVEIQFQDMPKEIKQQGEKFAWFRSQLHIVTPKGKIITMTYNLCEKEGNKHEESYTL